MKILFKTPMSRGWLDALAPLLKEFPEIRIGGDDPSKDVNLATADVVLAGELTEKAVESAKSLKIIFVPYAGVDALPFHVIRRRGVRVANVHVNAPFVAERAIALALAFYGKIIDYHNDLKRFKWHGYWAGLGVKDTWNSIQGRTCAVIGAGEIGKAIARLLKVFGCPVIGFKRHLQAIPLEDFDAVTLDLREAVDKSELVFVSLPLTPATRGILSRPILQKMTGKVLINVGRGELIDETAFFESLRDGVLKGAAIDAWYRYPQPGVPEIPPSPYPFHELPNVVLSPHVAGFTPEAAALNIEATVKNLRVYLQTGSPRWEVNTDGMY